jgi:small subunit ribosomal protein S6
MFLFDPTFGASFEKCEAEVRRLMDRAGAELMFCRKWDERRLAFRIRGRKRGVYALTYFKADPDKITPLERDAKLAENILRLLVLRADDVTPDFMERMVPTRAADTAKPSDDAGGAPKPEAEGDKKEPKGDTETRKGDKKSADEGAKATEPVVAESAVADASAGEEDTDKV